MKLNGCEKLPECKKCDLNNICSWIYEYKKYYNYVRVYSQKFRYRRKKENYK